MFVTWLQDDGSSGADTEEETDDTTPSSGSVTVLSEKTLDNGQKVSVHVCVSVSVIFMLHMHVLVSVYKFHHMLYPLVDSTTRRHC